MREDGGVGRVVERGREVERGRMEVEGGRMEV